MSYRKLEFGLLGFVCTLSCVMVALSKPARAGVFYNNWNYAVDSFDDSMTGNTVGGTKYEIFATAFQQTADKTFFAINSNFSLNGTSSNYADDGHVGWGDLLMDIGGSKFGIHFVKNNASGVRELGLYADVTTKTVARANGMALDNLRQYNAWVRQHGKTPSLGDLSADDPYFDQNQHIPNLIASGTRIGDVNQLSNLTGLGLDFAHFGANGTYTHVMSIDSSLLPAGNATWWIAPECDNDVIAHKVAVEDIPEPSTALGLGAVALLFGAAKSRRRQLTA